MSFLLKSARLATPITARMATPLSQRAFSTTLKMSVTIDSNVLSKITAGEKKITSKDGRVPDGPAARAQKHVGEQLTIEILREITEAERTMTGSENPSKGGPSAVAQRFLTNDAIGNRASNSSSDRASINNSEQHTGTLDSTTLHKITEAEKEITGQEQPVQGGPTAKAQQHAKEPITSEALHDITEGEKKVTGGERIKGGPTSQAQSELSKSRN